MAKPAQNKADIEALQRMMLAIDGVIDYTYVVSYIMRKCGCTHAEIGKVLGITKQGAKHITDQAEKVLDR